MALELRVANFERGFTDNYVNGARNAGQKFENLILTRNRKPNSRPGSLIFDTTAAATQQIPPGEQRTQFIKNHEGVLYEYSADEIFYRSGSSFNELVGPVDSNDAFGDVGTTASRNCASSWQGHLYTAIDTYNRPRKIYTDEDGNVQIRTMGLPSPGTIRGLSTAITLANALKTTFNAHVADLGEHNSADTAVTAANATDIDSLIVLVNDIKDRYVEHNADANAGGPVHVGLYAAGQLDSEDDVVTLLGAIALLNDIKSKYNGHDADAAAHTTGGTHQESTADATQEFTITPESNDGASYIYGVVYRYTYKIGTVTYIDRGPIQQVLVSNAGDFSTASNGNDLSDIPSLANSTFGTKEAWDTDNITVEIYRTENNGTILKRVAEISNGTTTYEDDTADSDLGINAYTTGGVVDFDPAPLCKYLIQTNDIVWFANVKEDSEEKPYRIRQSIALAPDAAPTTFTVDLDAEITGLSAVGIFPIVFTETKTYRLEGQVDAQGRGFVKKRVIDETVGCVSNNGIVQVKEGLYFPAKDGIYFTDGFRTTKVTNHLNESYKPLVQDDDAKKRIFGAYNPEDERVFWACTDADGATENQKIWVLDPHWGFPNGQGTFTTWAFGLNGFPTALEVIDGELIRADSRGYTFKHTVDADNTDPVVDTTETPEDWNTKQVIWDYISSAFTFGSEFQRKWVTRLLTTLKAITNQSIQPKSINDDSGGARNLKEIRLRTVFTWGDPSFTWGDEDFVWNAPATNNFIRRFPRRGLRCTYKQVQYTNSTTIISNSDTFGSVTVDDVTKVVTLDSGTWENAQYVGAIMCIGSIAYDITAATSTTVTLSDPGNTLSSGTENTWTIEGFRKDELFTLEGYTVLYDFFGDSNTAYRTGDDGGNA